MVKSKSSKPSETGIDRISNLPDPLISHILSLLPTNNAVATSILSTRWKFLWTLITNLDFCSMRHYGGKLETKNKLEIKRNKFTLFVNRALLLLNPPFIQNFRLKCYQDYFDPSYLNSWISVGFGRTVQEFDLSLELGEPIELPLSHIHCNVAFLKLDGDIKLNIPAAASLCFPNLKALHLHGITSVISSSSSVSFPNLKIMNLNSVNFANEESVQKLFSSSPVLDDLIIKRGGYDDVQCLIICIPSLTRLSIDFILVNYERMDKLLINSPALQYLKFVGGYPFEYLPAENLNSLLEANVNMVFHRAYHVDVENCINVINFIGSLSSVKFLSVSSDVLKAFRTTSVNISLDFHNLTRLELWVADCVDFSVIINNFLENMDNLEHIVMEGWGYCCSRQSWWTEPSNVPKCLQLRVTTVSFSDIIDDCCDHNELLRYFLKNAKVLKLLTIRIAHLSLEKQLEMLKKISLIPRGSQTCQVAFT